MTMLKLTDICKKFNKGTVDESRVFENFGLFVEKGQFVSIVGSNGSGKTTLLNLISGTIPIDSGKIELLTACTDRTRKANAPIKMQQGNSQHSELYGGGVHDDPSASSELPPPQTPLLREEYVNIDSLPEFKRAKRIGRVFQDPSKGTAPTMTIAENLSIADNKNKSYSLTFGLNKKRMNFYREELSSLGLGLEDKMNVKVGSLSGGQRQALSLFMSTLVSPDLLLLDEHTAALDPKASSLVMELTDKIIKEKRLTALMVTHNLRFAVEYGNRLLMMDKGKCIIDKTGKDKDLITVDDILGTFNSISIECGN